MRSYLFLSVGFLAAFLFTSVTKASLLLYEPFDYTGGATLVGQTDNTPTTPTPNQAWTTTGTNATSVGPTVTNSGLSAPAGYPTYPGSLGNAANTKNGGDNITPRISLQTTVGSASGTVYYSMLVQLPSVAVGNGTAGSFFAGFNNLTGSQTNQLNVVGAVALIHANGTAGYSFGIAPNSVTSTRVYNDAKVFGTSDTVLLVASYTFGPGTADDVSKLYINPPDGTLNANGITDSEITTLTPDATSIGEMATGASDVIKSFFLRDNSSEPPGGVNVDEVRVWAVPEPGSIGLIALAGAGSIARRRHRRC